MKEKTTEEDFRVANAELAKSLFTIESSTQTQNPRLTPILLFRT